MVALRVGPHWLVGEAGVEVDVAVEVALDHAVALAGLAFESGEVADGDVTPGVLDEASITKVTGDKGDGGSAGAEHLAEELLGERDVEAVRAVGADQQPPREALVEVVARVAGGGLEREGELGLDVAKGQHVELAATLELLTRNVDGGYVPAAGQLHVDRVEALLYTHQGWKPRDTFKAKHADFDFRTVVECHRHGSNACFDEEEPVDGLAGDLDIEAKGEVALAKGETTENFGFEMTEQGVPVGGHEGSF